MAFLQLPTIPEARANAEKWNAHWEHLLNKQLPAFTPEAVVTRRYNEILFNGDQDRLSMSYANHFETTCILRLSMAKEFFLCAAENLAARWTAASVSDRRKHVLIALASVCTIAKDLHDSRMSCPELTLDHLCEDPEVLLNLIASLVPDGFDLFSNAPLEELVYIANTAWEELGQQEHTFNELQKLVYRDTKTLRTKLIYMVIQRAYLSFLGRGTPPPTTVIKEREKPNEAYSKLLSDTAMKMNPVIAKQRHRSEKMDHKSRLKDRRVACAGCARVQMDGEANFMQCSSCKSKMKRDVPYCSKECQKAHWTAHKVICGKPLNLDVVHESLAASSQTKLAANPPSPYQHVTIGPAVPPFKRSLELSVDILKLAAADSLSGRADFLLELDPQGSIMVFTFPRTPAAAYTTCANAREHAMTRGDRDATAALCQFILWVLGAKKTLATPQMEWLVRRMMVEFRYPDLVDAIQALSKKQEGDKHRRAPLFFDFSEEDWTAVLKDMKLNL